MKKLGALDEIENPGSKGYYLQTDWGEVGVFVVRKDDDFVAYKNACPHLGVALEWGPDNFLDDEKEHIVCSTHGAVFQIDNGKCISGPCVDESLGKVEMKVEDGDIYINL